MNGGGGGDARDDRRDEPGKGPSPTEAAASATADTAAPDPEPDATTADAFLGGALTICQPARGFRAGLDAVLLAAAVPDLAAGSRVLDAGAGVGTAGLCLARRLSGVSVTLVERQPRLAALARRNSAANALADRVAVIEADVMARAGDLAAMGLVPESFACVMANPPWHVEGQGRAPRDPVEAAANAMPAAALEAWMRFLARMAAPGGTLVVVHRADALGRVLHGLERRFGAVEVLPLHPGPGAPAVRVIVRAVKGSRAPLTLHGGLVLHRPDGGFTEPVAAVLRTGSALSWPTRAHAGERSSRGA